MSINIGEGITKYIRIYHPVVDINFSENAVCATAVVSEKSNKPLVDRQSGEVVLDSEGNPIMRSFTPWNAVFWGKAVEPAKALSKGKKIDITQGNISKQKSTTSGKEFIRLNIFDFELSQDDYSNDNTKEEGMAADIADTTVATEKDN